MTYGYRKKSSNDCDEGMLTVSPANKPTRNRDAASMVQEMAKPDRACAISIKGKYMYSGLLLPAMSAPMAPSAAPSMAPNVWQ